MNVVRSTDSGAWPTSTGKRTAGYGTAREIRPAHSLRDMDIAPDTKDWTWVLQRRCPDCSMDASAVSGQDVAGLLRTAADQWAGQLRRDDVRVRADAVSWSPLEYACHVRDVCRRFDARLTLMLDRENPDFENWDQDATAVASRYGEQDPTVVSDELTQEARTFAARLDELSTQQWQRTGRRSDGARFTVDSFARYLIHDVVHHLHDVGGSGGPASPSE